MWTRQMILLCAAMFLVYAGQSFIFPVIPLYVTKLGGSASMAGMVLMAFSAPSFLVRPILGRVADRIGHAAMLTMGAIGLLFAGGLLFIPVLGAVFVASAVRGTAWAGANVGGYASLATVAPADRRGEAAGYYSGVVAAAGVLFPAVALWLVRDGDFTIVYAISCAVAALAIPMAWFLHKHNMAAHVEQTQTAPAATDGSIKVLNRGLITAMIINISASLPGSAVNAFLPLFAREQNLGNIGLYYVAAGVIAVAIRPLLGRRSDTLGQGRIIAFGLLVQACGYAIIWFSHTTVMVLAGAILSSVGPALVGSASTALAMEAAPPAGRGRALATFSMTFQIGMGLGAMIAGSVADQFGLRSMYVSSCCISLLGLVFLIANWKSLPKPTKV